MVCTKTIFPQNTIFFAVCRIFLPIRKYAPDDFQLKGYISPERGLYTKFVLKLSLYLYYSPKCITLAKLHTSFLRSEGKPGHENLGGPSGVDT